MNEIECGGLAQRVERDCWHSAYRCRTGVLAFCIVRQVREGLCTCEEKNVE